MAINITIAEIESVSEIMTSCNSAIISFLSIVEESMTDSSILLDLKKYYSQFSPTGLKITTANSPLLDLKLLQSILKLLPTVIQV